MSIEDTLALGEALKENQSLTTLNLESMLSLLSIENIYLPLLEGAASTMTAPRPSLKRSRPTQRSRR